MRITVNIPTEISLPKMQVKTIVREFLVSIVGEDCFINQDGLLEHWSSWPNWPHGSGTYTIMGKPTETQRAAFVLIDALKRMED